MYPGIHRGTLYVPPETKKGSNCLEPFCLLLIFTAEFLVGRAGFEPATNGLKVRCSTS
jgi:hypothetical protein